ACSAQSATFSPAPFASVHGSPLLCSRDFCSSLAQRVWLEVSSRQSQFPTFSIMLMEQSKRSRSRKRDHKDTKDTKIRKILCVLCVFVVFSLQFILDSIPMYKVDTDKASKEMANAYWKSRRAGRR